MTRSNERPSGPQLPPEGGPRLPEALLMLLSLVAATVPIGGPLLAGALLALLGASTLRRVSEAGAEFPSPVLSLGWVREVGRFLATLPPWTVARAPFLAPGLVFVVVSWSLASDSASQHFQQQASQVIPILLVGYVVEAGAIEWRGQPVDWALGLITVVILVAGEAFAMADLATGGSSHADVIAAAMAAGVTAIVLAAIQGAERPRLRRSGRRANRVR